MKQANSVSVTRRSLIQGAALMPALALPAIAEGADAELLAINARWIAWEQTPDENLVTDEEINASLDECYAMINRVRQIQATTLAGVGVKLRILGFWENNGCDPDGPRASYLVWPDIKAALGLEDPDVRVDPLQMGNA